MPGAFFMSGRFLSASRQILTGMRFRSQARSCSAGARRAEAGPALRLLFRRLCLRALSGVMRSFCGLRTDFPLLPAQSRHTAWKRPDCADEDFVGQIQVMLLLDKQVLIAILSNCQTLGCLQCVSCLTLRSEPGLCLCGQPKSTWGGIGHCI